MYELGAQRGRERQPPGTSLQEVTLMKNSVVCSSRCPSGMNKVRPRQREKTWTQLETTHRSTDGERAQRLALGDGHELNFNRAENRLKDVSRVSVSQHSLCLCWPSLWRDPQVLASLGLKRGTNLLPVINVFHYCFTVNDRFTSKAGDPIR